MSDLPNEFADKARRTPEEALTDIVRDVEEATTRRLEQVRQRIIGASNGEIERILDELRR